jgi:lipoprotein-anchoring transpeptidase ErfK/SrfK
MRGALIILITCCLASGTEALAKERGLSSDAVNTAEFRGKSGDRNKAVLIKAEVLLDRAHFSPGVIDGSDGENVRKAIVAFQKESGLRPSGRLNQETWSKLKELSPDPAITDYTLTDEDVKGPFTEKIPPKLEEQAALDRLGYTSPTELLAEKFHMSESLLKALNKGKKHDAAGVAIAVANVSTLNEKKVKASKIEIDKSSHDVRVLDKEGKLIAFYPASIGSTEKPAPSGLSKVTKIVTNPNYTYNPDYKFKGVEAQEKFTIKPGPNNPVGLVWIALTGEGYGIHATPEPDKVGKSASHGCVRLTNWDALQLAGMVEKGTPVEFLE